MRKTITRRICAWLLAGCLLCAGRPAAAEGSPAPAPEELSAQCAVLLSADTGTVLYEKNARLPHAMASTTKILTALLTIEEAERRDDPVVEITEEMVPVEGSSMGLQAGDRLRLSTLAAGMLLASGNDAANAAALYLDGSLEAFACRMNDRAEKLGLVDSLFVTPSGLDEEGHHSTALDMALLTRAALGNEEFRRYCSCAALSLEFVEPEKTVAYANHNRLLELYEGCIGVKTGYTQKAGRCLVSAAKRDGMTLIAVTLDAPDDWNDHIALLDYGFAAMENVTFGGGFTGELPVVGSVKETVPVAAGSGCTLCLPKAEAQRIACRVLLPAFCYAPIKKRRQGRTAAI